MRSSRFFTYKDKKNRGGKESVMSERQEIVNPSMAWKEGRDAEREQPADPERPVSDAFWSLPNIERAEACLDVWASVMKARGAGIGATPTLDAIMSPSPDAPPEGSVSALPFREPGPRTIKVRRLVTSAHREHRKLQDGSERLVWLRRWVEMFIEKHRASTSQGRLSPSECIFLTVERWMVDIGQPPMLETFMLNVYPRSGPYAVSLSAYDETLLVGNMKATPAAIRTRGAFDSVHRQALRNLSEYLRDFGVKIEQKKAS